MVCAGNVLLNSQCTHKDCAAKIGKHALSAHLDLEVKLQDRPFPDHRPRFWLVFSLQFVWQGQTGVRHGFDSRNIKERALFCFCFLLVPMKPTLKGGSQPLHARICSTKRLPLSPSQAGHVPDNGRVAPCRSLSISRAVLSMGAFAFAGYPFGVV